MKTIRELIEPFLYSHLEYFVSLVDEGGADTVFEGIRVLDDPEKFVQGTLVDMTALLYIHYVKTGDARAEKTLSALIKFLGFATADECHTWGKLALLRAFSNLGKAGLIDKIASETVEIVKKKTEYDDFFDKKEMKLRGAATNYLQVAMACAGLRESLGWENEGMSEKIRDLLLSVMKESSTTGWMDENPPYGRFDRYTLLVTSELSDNLMRLGMDLPDFAAENLRKAAKITLAMANRAGDGINYGRSLSCHGDGASEEILASALSRGLVAKNDVPLAVAYASKIVEKILSVWYDKERKSFNIWWDGRSTNRYRQSKRVLEVNLDMANHLYTTLLNFERAGLADEIPNESLIPTPVRWESFEIPFIEEPERAAKTVVLRKSDDLLMLPLVGVGALYNWSGYLPFPALSGRLEAAPEAAHPFLTPDYEKDGKHYRPIQYFKTVRTENEAGKVTVRASGNLSLLGGKFPVESDLPFTGTFVFSDEGISVLWKAEGDFDRVSMVLGTLREGDVLTATGFEAETPLPTVGEYDFMTPHGAMVKASLAARHGNAPVGYFFKI